jgi:hypothetical protein
VLRAGDAYERTGDPVAAAAPRAGGLTRAACWTAKRAPRKRRAIPPSERPP